MKQSPLLFKVDNNNLRLKDAFVYKYRQKEPHILTYTFLRLPMAERVMKFGCAGGRGFAPRQYCKESFSFYRETGKVFSPEMPFYSKL